MLLAAFRSHPLFGRLRLIWADGSYGGQLIPWMMQALFVTLTVVFRPRGVKGFVLLKRRWVVERSFAWLNHSRRLSKDYETRIDSSEAFIQIAFCRLMLQRLARAQVVDP